MSYNKDETPHCKKCGVRYFWNKNKNPPAESKRGKDGKMGWWQEYSSKEDHTDARCATFKESGEFANESYMKDSGNTPSTTQVKLDYTDAEKSVVLNELVPAIRSLIIVETTIKNEFASYGIDLNPQHIGLYVKLLQDARLHS
jgi:predicted  nucleic acid-binding Zn-ribbon protein